MEVVSGDNWSYKTCKAPVKSSSPTVNVLQTGCPSCRPTKVSDHWRKTSQLVWQSVMLHHKVVRHWARPVLWWVTKLNILWLYALLAMASIVYVRYWQLVCRELSANSTEWHKKTMMTSASVADTDHCSADIVCESRMNTDDRNRQMSFCVQ